MYQGLYEEDNRGWSRIASRILIPVRGTARLLSVDHQTTGATGEEGRTTTRSNRGEDRPRLGESSAGAVL